MALDAARIDEIAERHGFDAAAGQAMAEALRSGGGGMAQFSHPKLGGMGQWSRGGMLMIGEMNNHELKARVAGLAGDLSAAMAEGGGDRRPAEPGDATEDHAASGGGSDWWPGNLGRPGATGSQNGVRYAVFPDARRLAIQRDGRVEVRDTGDHRIGGVSQSLGGSTTLRFTSQRGDVDLETLPTVA